MKNKEEAICKVLLLNLFFRKLFIRLRVLLTHYRHLDSFRFFRNVKMSVRQLLDATPQGVLSSSTCLCIEETLAFNWYLSDRRDSPTVGTDVKADPDIYAAMHFACSSYLSFSGVHTVFIPSPIIFI